MSTVYVMTPILLNLSPQLCKTSQVAYVCHHMYYRWHHIHTLWQQSLVSMTSYALYSWHHTHYVWHVIYCVLYHIHYMCDFSQWLFLWHYTLYVYDLSPLYGITHSVWQPKYSLYDITPTNSDITRLYSWITFTIFIISHPLYMRSNTIYLWHQSHCIYDNSPTMFMTSYSIYMTSHMAYEWQHNQCIRHHTYSICVITPTWLMVSQPMYVWNHTHCL